jgi:peptidyl-prolyl cis-trans isomerase C
MSIRRSRIAAAPAALLLLLVAGTPGCSRETTAPEDAGAPEAASGPDAPAAAPSPAPATAPEAVAPATSATPAAAAPGTPGAEPVIADADLPAVVARVDGKDVTREDLLSRAAEARGALAQRGVPPPPSTRSFYRSVINDLVGNALLYRELEAQGKAAPAADVDAQFAAMRSRFASDAEFDAAIAQRGFDRERLRREIAESLTVQKWVTETVMPTLTVSEAEAREFYALNEERMIDPERVRARHILLRVDPQGTLEQKQAQKQKTEALRARIAGGEEFSKVATEASEDPGSGPRGGELGWIVRGQTVPAFEKVAFELEPGKLSDVVETRFGFHLIEVLEKKAEGKVAFEQARPRIEEMMRQRKLEAAVREKLNELGSKAKVEILL